jgi:uncharacterized protein YjbI with pentapeptide repeats
MLGRKEKRAPKPMTGRRHWFGVRKAAVQPVKDVTEAPAPPSPRDEAIAVLKQGVKAWNAWITEKRKADPKFQADLSMVDFRLPEWQQTSLWRRPFRNAPDPRVCLFEGEPGDPSLTSIDLQDVNLWRARLDGADFSGAHLERANLSFAWLDGAYLRYAHLEGVDLRMTSFIRVNLFQIYYRNYAGLRWVPFWPFRKNLMLGKFFGIRGLESCYGNAGFRRDALDQDFIDDKYESVRLRGLSDVWRIPGRLVFALWGFFDYGRSILSLLIFALGVIGAIGWWYQGLEASHAIAFRNNLADIGADSPTLRYLRPWFAALMGFATLGLNDMVRPNTLQGAVAMVLDVLAGFSTLGLFIAVFQNKFARRS